MIFVKLSRVSDVCNNQLYKNYPSYVWESLRIPHIFPGQEPMTGLREVWELR